MQSNGLLLFGYGGNIMKNKLRTLFVVMFLIPICIIWMIGWVLAYGDGD